MPAETAVDILDPGGVGERDSESLRQPHDAVDHPSHYVNHPSGIECIEVVEYMNFNLGNRIKYVWRAGAKSDELEDIRKAAWYLNREIDRVEKLRSERL